MDFLPALPVLRVIAASLKGVQQFLGRPGGTPDPCRLPYELQLGWRYTRAGRATRRNGFISFISGVSMLGIGLGVAALIIVLSVMNGFQKEVRDRMLGVVSHIEILSRDGQALQDIDAIMDAARKNPEVVGVAPFIATQALIARGEDMKGTLVRGIEPTLEPQVTDIATTAQKGVLDKLVPGEFGIVLGGELARSLFVREGDRVTLLAPGGQVTPAGVVPRLKQFTVVGTFDSGHYEYDSALAMIHEEDAARVFRLEGPTGIRVKLKDLNQAREVADEFAVTLPGSFLVRDWTRQNKTWFAAVQVEKRMMFIILTLIVAVAAFNLVSTLVMTVTDKRADIAILRTLGSSPRSIMGIFVVQGAMVGVMGTLGGLLLHGAWVRGVQHRRDRAGDRAAVPRQLPAEGHLPHQQDAERSAAQRHLADHAHLADPRLCRDAVSELARQPRQSCRGAAL